MLTKENTRKWDKVIFVTPLFLFTIFGYVLSTITGNVLFVKNVGADSLPYTYILTAIFSTLASFLVAGKIDSVKVPRLIQAVSAIGAIFIFGMYLLIGQGSAIGYFGLLIGSQILYVLLGSILMWDLSLKICTPLEGKWAFGYFSFGASFGGVMAGLVFSFCGAKFGAKFSVPIVIASLLAVFAIASVLYGKYFSAATETVAPGTTAAKPKGKSRRVPCEARTAGCHHQADVAKKDSYFDSLKQGFANYRQSRMAKLLLACLILFFSVRWIGDYEFQKIVGAKFSEGEFAKISGFVSIAENGGLIILFLFAQKFIFEKLGVLNTLLSSPAVIFAPFMTLLFFPVYAVAIVLKVIIKIINYSTFNSSVRLIFTSIPNAIRSSLMTFISGNSESGGMLLAGVGLVVLTKLIPNTWVIACGVILTFGVGFFAFLLRREYFKQVVKNLEGGDTKDIHTAIENLAEPAYRTSGVQEFMKILRMKKFDDVTIRKIVFALGKIDNTSVIPALLDIFEKYDVTVKYAVVDAVHSFSDLNERLKTLPFTRLNLIETYQHVFLNDEDSELKIFILENLKDFDPDNVIEFLKDAVKSGSPEIQYQAIKAMKYFHDRGIVRYVKPFLDHEKAIVRASSIIALWQFSEMRPELLKLFVEIMTNESKDSMLATFLIISKLKISWEDKFVEGFLQNEDVNVRTMAALTLMALGNKRGFKIVVENLINKTEFSKVVARNLKTIPKNVKWKILSAVHGKDEQSINVCVENLRDAYLNFGEEIEFLTHSKEDLRSGKHF